MQNQDNPPQENTEIETPVSAPDNVTTLAKKKRNRLLLIVAVLCVLFVVGYMVIYFIYLVHYESTDNAYVQGDIVQITPQVTGTVLNIGVKDTDFVKEGQTLLSFDKTDAQMALEQAEANLAKAVRDARALYINNQLFASHIRLAQANFAQAIADVQKAKGDLARRSGLGEALSKEDLAHAQAQLAVSQGALKSAAAAVNSAEAELKANQALTDDMEILEQPNVLDARAKLKEAYITLARMSIPAPVDGYVAQRSVQVGQKVNAGTPLMSVIPLGQVWVDANFKELQLQNIRIGQPVELTADIYGSKIKYKGVVEGVNAGTGSAFSLLPAQNATGNWIKVVQRLPVRIKLDADDVKKHPLQVGLSMVVKVNTKDKGGKMLADSVSKTSASETKAFKVDALETRASEYADAIISKQLGLVKVESEKVKEADIKPEKAVP